MLTKRKSLQIVIYFLSGVILMFVGDYAMFNRFDPVRSILLAAVFTGTYFTFISIKKKTT